MYSLRVTYCFDGIEYLVNSESDDSFVGLVTHHCVCLAASCLPICKYCTLNKLNTQKTHLKKGLQTSKEAKHVSL